MADRLTALFAEWYLLGGAVLLADDPADMIPRSPEQVIAESTAYCRDSGRLTWVVLDWLQRHIETVNVARLMREMQRGGDLAVLGVLCDAARQRQPHPKFEAIIRACAPAERVEPFFRRVARSPLALHLTRENPLELFLRWNYLCNELRYL